MKNDKPIGLVHNRPVGREEDNYQSSIDVMVQVEAIEKALDELGHRSVRLPFSRDLHGFLGALQASGAEAVFNLCESVDDDPLFIGHPAAVLELLDIPFTGSSAATLLTTTDKYLVKRLLQAEGIATPAFFLYEGQQRVDCCGLRFPLILKPQFQDASIGIDQESVIADEAGLPDALTAMYELYGPLLVEEYIEGREFNISLFGFPEALVMPAAEIDLSGYPEELFRIVGYRAKWDPDSVEFHQSKRVFPELAEDLLAPMAAAARRCYALFRLRDYGRVDFRIGGDGAAYVLEINANPCLSPDAGFVAAVGRSGVDYTGMVGRFRDFLARRNR